jgi:glycosyltransferase involved in cell wall biosynthesis
MHILFFVDCFGAGGKERRLLELIKGLLKNKEAKCSVVVMDKNVHYKEIFELDIDIHFLVRKTKKDLSIFGKFYSLCAKIKPDLIHSFNSMTTVYAIPASKLLKIKIVNGMVCDAPAHIKFLSENHVRSVLTFPFSNVIVGNSYAGLGSYKVPVNKGICIHNGFDFTRIAQLTDKQFIKDKFGIKTTYVIGMVASFSNLKDHATFFKAAEIITENRDDITFITVGDGRLKQGFEQQYAKNKRILFLGSQGDVESIINVFDIGVLTTYTEGISNAIMEYMALKKPVIATDGGGTVELISDNDTGYLIPVKASEILLEKIIFLLNNRDKANQMGNSGYKRIENLFSIKKMINEYLNLYKKLTVK